MTAPSLASSSVKEEWEPGNFSGTYLSRESASWAGETFVLYIFSSSSKEEERQKRRKDTKQQFKFQDWRFDTDFFLSPLLFCQGAKLSFSYVVSLLFCQPISLWIQSRFSSRIQASIPRDIIDSIRC